MYVFKRTYNDFIHKRIAFFDEMPKRVLAFFKVPNRNQIKISGILTKMFQN